MPVVVFSFYAFFGGEFVGGFKENWCLFLGNECKDDLVSTNCSVEDASNFACEISSHETWDGHYKSQECEHKVEHQPEYVCPALADQMDIKLGEDKEEQNGRSSSGENICRQGDFNPLEVRIDSPGLHLSTSLGLSNGTPYSSKSENNRYSGSSQHKTDLAHLKDDAKLGDMSLREWLARPERVVDQLECLHIFVQIVETVDLAHSKGLVLQNIRPSCLRISPVNLISFIDSTNSLTSPGSSSSDCCNGRISLHTNGHNNKCNMNEETQFVRIGQEGQSISAQNTRHDCQGNRTSARPCGWQGTIPGDAVNSGPETPKSCTNSCAPNTGESNVHKYLSSVALAYSSHEISVERIFDAGEGMRNTKMKAKVEEENNQENFRHSKLNQISQMEQTWYTSPEELVGGSCSFSSNIYSLGILFFELFCPFSSEAEQSKIMSDLRHRVPPPQLLLKWPKEIAFCLWLLHPDPNCRPKLSELLQSEIINEARKVLVKWKNAHLLEEEIADSELLLDFLILVQQQKQEKAEKLIKAVTCLTSDIEVVLNKQSVLEQKGISSFVFSKEEKLALGKGKKSIFSCPKLAQTEGTNFNNSSVVNVLSTKAGKTMMLGKQLQQGNQSRNMSHGKKLGKSNLQSRARGDFISRSGRVVKNFKELEKVYFSTRSKEKKSVSDKLGRYSYNDSSGQGPILRTEACDVNMVSNLSSIKRMSDRSSSDGLGSFFNNLCKYLRFSKFKVKATLRQGDLLNTSSLVCSLDFDRDKEFFATAGSSKKIKVFECDTVLNEDLDIHYPIIEMNSQSKLSSICWNSYIKNHIASSGFDGVVQLWDITRNQAIMNFEEHQKRVWSVDFSQSYPTRLASGGDDGNVKLWNINQEGSIGTISTNANVCSVQFPPDSAWLLAFGSADYKIYCYDLRNLKTPWCILASHSKTVSNVKFLDSTNLVSASIDGTLKLWDLATSTGGVLCNPVLTYTGHKNEKNFVGLSVADGYIATGSESNEVFVYHKSFPMPVASYKFNCVDPVNGQEVYDDDGQFVSSVCWRGQSQTLVAANCKGNIEIMEMV